ncbi:hypothetical protein SEA_ZIMMER_8 [Mycobacterium phage Zimmer]|nr:hypothetical protein SEA_ZIMMER_8 [Mycobacterium phage Zimmer]
MAARLLGTARPDFRLGSVRPSRLYLGSNPFWGTWFTDEFPTDAAGIPGWTKVSGFDARVVSGRAAISALGMNSGGNAIYRPPIVAPIDDHAVRFRINAPVTAAATDNAAEIWMRCTDDNVVNYGVYAGFLQGPNRLTLSSRINGASVARTAAVDYPFDVDLEFRATGRTFTVTRLDTGLVLATWADTTNLTSVGAAYRAFKVVLNGNYPFFQQMYSSPSIDRFEVVL